ncbi:MAG: glycerophosphodiester phosphodiesterase family protein [Cruoricaptor ignavus]|nr:glycerophosphodiester phosphodiesterase family protein [Cruoricaptor ignavus]
MKQKFSIRIAILLWFVATFSFAQIRPLTQFPDDKVMVVAHRGDWRNAPENSVWAIKLAMEMGVDMVEIDLARSKDGVIFLMHDKTVNRTTNGKGKTEDFTWEELQQLYLRDGSGQVTQMKIPSLEDILKLTKGKIYINLDKGFNYIEEVYPLLKKYDMLDEVLFKGSQRYPEFNAKYGHLKNDIHYMPIVNLDKVDSEDVVKEYQKNYKVYGFEFVFKDEKNIISFSRLRKKGTKVWMNSLWKRLNPGYYDDLALESPKVYDWYLKNNVNIIQTDRPKILIQYLKEKGLKMDN